MSPRDHEWVATLRAALLPSSAPLFTQVWWLEEMNGLTQSKWAESVSVRDPSQTRMRFKWLWMPVDRDERALNLHWQVRLREVRAALIRTNSV